MVEKSLLRATKKKGVILSPIINPLTRTIGISYYKGNNNNCSVTDFHGEESRKLLCHEHTREKILRIY